MVEVVLLGWGEGVTALSDLPATLRINSGREGRITAHNATCRGARNPRLIWPVVCGVCARSVAQWLGFSDV